MPAEPRPTGTQRTAVTRTALRLHPGARPCCALCPHAQVTEADIIENLEKMCNPDVEAGEWVSKIDLQEEGTELKLVDMGQVRDQARQRLGVVKHAPPVVTRSRPA